MRVYIAAPYADRDGPAADLAQTLTRAGFTVTSSWLGETHPLDSGSTGAAPAFTEAQIREHCAADFADVTSSDVLVLMTSETGTSGGRHVETGYALAFNIPVFVLGEPENVFHRGLCVVEPDQLALVLALIEHREAVHAFAGGLASTLTWACGCTESP